MNNKLHFNSSFFIKDINLYLVGKIDRLVSEAIKYTRAYYLGVRKKEVNNFIVHSMVYNAKIKPAIGVVVDINMGGDAAPYAIFVDKGFTAPGGGPKIFDGYHFSEKTEEYFMDKVDDVVVDTIVKSLRNNLRI